MLGEHAKAARLNNARLRHATAAGDIRGRAKALADLGRSHLAMGAFVSAVIYLREALVATKILGDSDEETRVRHRLGFALWAAGKLEESKEQLLAALGALETSADRYRDRNTASLYVSTQHALQRVLVELGRHHEALVIAERGRCNSIEVMSEKTTSGLSPANLEPHTAQKDISEENKKERPDPWSPSTVEHILEVVNKQKAPVIYYSIAAGRLYSWLIQPHEGILRFHQTCLIEQAEHGNKSLPVISPDELQANTSARKLERLVKDWSSWLKTADSRKEEDRSDNNDRPSSGLAGMITPNHLLNSSPVAGSVAGSVASLQDSKRSSIHGPRKKQPSWQDPPCLNTLYQMLIAPFEDLLPSSDKNKHGSPGRRDLLLVVQGALVLCPWNALRPTDAKPLCERYTLLVAPALKTHRHKHAEGTPGAGSEGMPCVVADVRALREAELVADMLRATPLLDYQASKEAVLAQLPQAECVHFATHICWKTPGIILSPGEVVDSQSNRRLDSSVGSGDLSAENEEENTEPAPSNEELPPSSEFMLTAAEIMNLKLTARLVVLSCSPSSAALLDSDNPDAATTAGDGVSTLCRAFLAAGAQAILVTLWPAPQDTATMILYRALYSALLQGSRVAKALGDAMETVRHTKHFSHLAHWAGLCLLGSNVRLSNKVELLGQALCNLLAAPDECRNALRVCLHLVEKSLQRIVRGQTNAMYTTQKSIENKAGTASGWRQLLMSVGFRFEPAANDVPSSVFFPQSDPEERLKQCSASLKALLMLSPTTLQTLSKLISNGSEVSDDIIDVIRVIMAQLPAKEGETVEVAVNVRLWRVNGCHELLESLGFDLAEIGQDEVTLRIGKAATRRQLQFVLQALLALFDTQEAPRSLSPGSSVESLASDGDLEQHSDRKSPQRQHRQESVTSVPPDPLQLGSCGGAFTMYVRGSETGRGEPDDSTAPPPAPPPPPPTAATPPAAPAPPQDVSLALAHQTKIKTLYTSPKHSHPRYLDFFYKLAASNRRNDEEKIDQINQPSTSKRASRRKKGTGSRTSMTQVRHMSGVLMPTISEVYHERNINLGLAPPLVDLLLAEDSKTELRATSSSENLLSQNLEIISLDTDIQTSDLTTAEIIELKSKFKKEEPKTKEEAGPSGFEKRSVSPSSELSRRDEGDERSMQTQL